MIRPGPLEIGLILAIILVVGVPVAVALLISQSSKKRSREEWLKYQRATYEKEGHEQVGIEQTREEAKPMAEGKGYVSYIPDSVFDKLPLMVKTELVKMPAERQGLFVDEFRRKSKSVGIAYLLWFIIGLHYIYLNKLGWQLFYWVTLGGFLIWAFIDIFRIPGMVRDYNKDIAVDVCRDLKIFSS